MCDKSVIFDSKYTKLTQFRLVGVLCKRAYQVKIGYIRLIWYYLALSCPQVTASLPEGSTANESLSITAAISSSSSSRL